jgi:hypothetical protein
MPPRVPACGVCGEAGFTARDHLRSHMKAQHPRFALE